MNRNVLFAIAGGVCVVITVFLLILFYGFSYLVSAQPSSPAVTPHFLTYENPSTGVKIEYPEDWSPMNQYGLAFLSPQENDSDMFREGLTVARGHHGNESLSELAAKVVKSYSSSLPSFKLIESNESTLHGNPAQALVYTFNLPGNGTIKVLESATLENDNIYIFRYVAQENKYDSYLPTINRMINSFKIESSLESSSQNAASNSARPSESNPQNGNVKVLSSNSFLDSIGYIHVVGEIENDTPDLLTYVKATGTFYDKNDKVVGTGFAFTSPSDLPVGQKAPFEIILTSASIPLSDIDHYSVIASHE